MFRNLEAEIKRAGFSRKELAVKLGCDASTISGKLNGRTPFTLPEAKKMKDVLGIDVSIEVLFAIEENKTA